jgi:DNA-binding CsgD family transcriptional regulator
MGPARELAPALKDVPVGLLVTGSQDLARRVQSASSCPVSTLPSVMDVTSTFDSIGAVVWILVDISRAQSLDELGTLRTSDYWGPVFAVATHFNGTQLADLARTRTRPLALDCTDAALSLLLNEATGWSKPYVRFRECCVQWSLTPREQQIFQLSLRGVPRCSLSVVLGTSENTLKSHVRGLLRKARKTNIAEVVAEIYDEHHLMLSAYNS